MLNEHDEFEDLESYLAKTKQNQIVVKKQKFFPKAPLELKNEVYQECIEFEYCEEIEMESQEVSKIVSASQQRQVKSRNFKDKILTLQSHEANQDHKDKENLSALQNRISVLEPLKPEKQHKSSSKDA